MSSFLVSLLQNSTNHLLANGKWNVCFYHYSFLQKCFQFLLASAWFVIRYFSIVKETVLLVFPDYSFIKTKPPVSFFLCHFTKIAPFNAIWKLRHLKKRAHEKKNTIWNRQIWHQKKSCLAKMTHLAKKFPKVTLFARDWTE